MSKRPVGQRFSHLYLERGQPQNDSDRARSRIAAYYHDAVKNKSDVHGKIVRSIEKELGVKVPYGYGYRVDNLIKSAELRDLLDVITLVWREISYGPGRYASANSQAAAAKNGERWIDFVVRVFREENLMYTVDQQGGVHFYADEEFVRNRAATLQALGGERYGAALEAFEAAYAALDQVPADTTTALRRVFEALEIVTKLLDGRVARLGATEVERYLKPHCLGRFADGSTERGAANLFLSSLANWVNALQAYRHGQAVEEPNPPPLDLAVALLSSGATYLRFLIEVSEQDVAPGR